MLNYQSVIPTFPRLAPELLILTQDVFHLLASHRMLRWLRTELTFGDAVNAWLAPLAIQRENIPGIYTGRGTGRLHCQARIHNSRSGKAAKLRFIKRTHIIVGACHYFGELTS